MTALLFAFLHGVIEFRSDVTAHYDDLAALWYDRGRELAHRVTLRHWD
jgi:hypothetical protein